MPDSNIAFDITRKSKTNFSLSFAMLPEEKRDAIHTVYAFCRCTDDIVDDEGSIDEKGVHLQRWKEELELGLRGKSTHPLLNRLHQIVTRFNIPAQHFFDLVRGMSMDLEKNRYTSFEELYTYCYSVASTVGLMCSEIFGYKNQSTRQYAIDLGIALQLTNIVRDVHDDARRDRVYIPMEDFERFAYAPEQLFRSEYNEEFIRMMRFQVERAKTFYSKARTSLAEEDHRAFFAARIMDKIYFGILKKIEKKNFAVFEKKIALSRVEKFHIAMTEYFSRTPLQYASSV